jgi:ankyrin repeat protein
VRAGTTHRRAREGLLSVPHGGLLAIFPFFFLNPKMNFLKSLVFGAPQQRAAPSKPSLKAQNLDEALLDAAAEGDIEGVRLQVANGANIEAVYDDGETALILAAQKGNLPIVEFLVDHSAKLEVQKGQDFLSFV